MSNDDADDYRSSISLSLSDYDRMHSLGLFFLSFGALAGHAAVPATTHLNTTKTRCHHFKAELQRQSVQLSQTHCKQLQVEF